MSSKPIGLVACDVLRGEFEKAALGREVVFKFLEYSLHSFPQKMGPRLTQASQELFVLGVKRVALGYGLCSNGVAGISPSGPLVMPRCHDCVGLLLGSPRRYFEMFNSHPGTYFLSDGWIRNCGDPLGSVENKYAPKMGLKKAIRGMALELVNYKTICLINNEVGDLSALKTRTMQNCQVFEKEYMEIKSDIDYFRRLIDGPHDQENFICLEKGDKIEGSMFDQR
jgi:hypothetical protein